MVTDTLKTNDKEPIIKKQQETELDDLQILVNRLKEADLSTKRFLKVSENKAAFEIEWQNNLYAPEELEHYPRWGIAGGEGLVPLEADKPEMVNILRNILPRTLEVITPRRQLPHFFFKVSDGEVPNKVLHLPNDPEGAGEIRSQSQYFVAAGTTIKFNDLQTGEPKTGTYKILHNRPIAELSYIKFMKSIKTFLGKNSDQQITKDIMQNGAETGTRHHYGIRYATRLIRHEHIDPVAALDILKRWNKKCKPPMNEKDLERMIKNAMVYGKDDPPENKIAEAIKEIKESKIAIVALGKEYYLITQGKKCILVDPEGKPIDSCNLKSVDGPRFRKALIETTGIDKKIINEKTIEFQVLNQKEKYIPTELDMGRTLTLLNEKFIFKCPTDTRELLGYNDGQYVLFECHVHEVLQEEYGEELKSYFVEETLKHLQRSNYVDREEINKFVNKIPIQNGLFNLLTREVEPFDPDQIFTYKLNVKYDPSKECPTWLKFLKQILRSEDIPLLQEIMGYCVLPAMPFHKIFWFYGVGRNGKDRVILTLEHVLGEDNCSHLNLGELRESRRFSVAQLYGKLLNVSSEPDAKYPISTNILKQVSGENTIHAELKGKNKRLAFTNKAKIVVVGNNFPKVEDTSIGFWERVGVLNYPFIFTGEDVIPNIERTWLDTPDEVSGIFNWLLEGLYRLKQNKGFSSSKTTEETKAEFMRVSDPFTAWLNDCCILISVGKVTRDEAYNSYKNYSDELGATPDNARNFYTKIRKTPKIKDYRTKINGKTERGFQGLTIKTEEERENNNSQKLLVSEGSRVSSSAYSSSNKNHKDNIKNIVKREYVKPDTSDTPDTKNKNPVDIDITFQIQCFDCGATLGKHEVYSFGGNRFCRKCRMKIEAQKKKPRCKNLTFKEDQPFCEWLQSFLADPKQCASNCDGWEEV